MYRPALATSPFALAGGSKRLPSIFAAHEPKAGELLGSSEYCLLLLVRDVLAGFLASLLAALAAHLLNF